jgi:tartrate dehydrogenase/decarboxylase/D-malate dehydrogenase
VAPDDLLDRLRPFDAVFLGALGDPGRIPDHITLEPLIRMRQGFDQYACVRPCRMFRGIPSPLAKPGRVDFVVVRENSEGEYAVCGGRIHQREPQEVAVQSAVHTRRGVERILRFGFRMAMARRKRLTMITKSNALRYGMVLWDDVLECVRAEFPEVEADRRHADATAMDFVRRPDCFDVIVASNLFGDLLSDLGGAIVGGLGLAPSANINPERTAPSMFEPVHGSAPDIAGQNKANPLGAIGSVAAMFEYTFGLKEEAAAIYAAIEKVLNSGRVTADLRPAGPPATTSQVGDAILELI